MKRIRSLLVPFLASLTFTRSISVVSKQDPVSTNVGSFWCIVISTVLLIVMVRNLECDLFSEAQMNY